ncbi:hypothetical protein [Streptomyces rubrogriseus]|uniref:hypothetical protein n=1 Tax=Streptomyces rubrogriseus TaxID=194673 RepID=UPI000D59ADBA|nr:hypothetical protein [Streptomyces rubrogriseus]
MPASTPSVWPVGVVARYRTVGGADVDLTGDGKCVRVRCSGCGVGGDDAYYPPAAHRLAEKHAGKCRRVAAPTA